MKHEDDITKVSLSQRIHELEARMITLMHALHAEPALSIDYKRLCEEPQRYNLVADAERAISLDRKLTVAVEALEKALSVFDGSSVGGAISGEIVVRNALDKIKDAK